MNRDDDVILATAALASADCLVTGDNDLLTIGEHQGGESSLRASPRGTLIRDIYLEERLDRAKHWADRETDKQYERGVSMYKLLGAALATFGLMAGSAMANDITLSDAEMDMVTAGDSIVVLIKAPISIIQPLPSTTGTIHVVTEKLAPPIILTTAN